MDSSQRKKLKIMIILFAVLLLIGFMRYKDKLMTFASSSDGDANDATVTKDDDVMVTFDQWRTPIPEIGWQKPATVELSVRDPMRLDMSTVKIKPPKPRPRIPSLGSTTDVNEPDLIVVEGTAFHVKGIVYSEEASSSIILEDQVLHEGDSILGAVIIKINKGSVEFEKDGMQWTAVIGGRTEENK